MSLLTKFAKTLGQPMMGGMGNQNRFSTMMPFSPGMSLGAAAQAGQNNPNPLKQIKAPQTGSATTAGIQQMAQKTARTKWLHDLFPIPYTRVKAAEVATGGSSAPAASSSALGSGGSGGSGGAGNSALGSQPGRVGSQQGNQAGQQGGGGGIGGGAQGAMNGALGGQMGGQIGAFGVVRPGWNTLRPGSQPIGGVTSPGKTQTKLAMLTGALPPVPGQTANAPVPQPGMPPTQAPQMPPPNGGAPVAQGMGQPSLDPATGQPMQPPAPGAPAGGQPPAPAPGAPGAMPTAPMQDPMPPPLPVNPRPLPPRAATPHDNMQNSLMSGLGHDMDMADAPMNAGEAEEDMQSQAMAMGSKTASSDAWLAFLNPNSGFRKQARSNAVPDPSGDPFKTLGKDAPLGGRPALPRAVPPPLPTTPPPIKQRAPVGSPERTLYGGEVIPQRKPLVKINNLPAVIPEAPKPAPGTPGNPFSLDGPEPAPKPAPKPATTRGYKVTAKGKPPLPKGKLGLLLGAGGALGLGAGLLGKSGSEKTAVTLAELGIALPVIGGGLGAAHGALRKGTVEGTNRHALVGGSAGLGASVGGIASVLAALAATRRGGSVIPALAGGAAAGGLAGGFGANKLLKKSSLTADMTASDTVLGGAAAAGGLGMAGVGAAVRSGANRLQDTINKYVPFDPGAADRLNKYTTDVGSAATPAKKMVSYVGHGHDVLSKPVIGGMTGVDLAKKFYTSPVTKPFLAGDDMWGKGGKGEHFEAFAKSPMQAQGQLVKEMHGDNVERFVKPRFAARYEGVNAQIPRSAGKNWWDRADVKADVQPKFDAVDAAKKKVIEGAKRSGGGAQGAFLNDAYRTVRQNDPKLFAEMRRAGVKTPADMAKLPPEVQTKILTLFSEKSDIGHRTSREFSAGWRGPTKQYERLVGNAGAAASAVSRATDAIRTVGRGGRAATIGGLGLAGAGTIAALRDQYKKAGDMTKAALSLTADEGGEDAPALPGSPMRGWQWKVLQKEEEQAEKSWMPRLFRTGSTPLTELLASPAKQGLLGGLAGGGAGAGLGMLANKAVPTGQEDWKNALVGGGLGAVLGGFQAYGHRRRQNDKVTDALRRTPPGATVDDYNAVQESDAAKKKPKAAPGATKAAGVSPEEGRAVGGEVGGTMGMFSGLSSGATTGGAAGFAASRLPATGKAGLLRTLAMIGVPAAIGGRLGMWGGEEGGKALGGFLGERATKTAAASDIVKRLRDFLTRQETLKDSFVGHLGGKPVPGMTAKSTPAGGGGHEWTYTPSKEEIAKLPGFGPTWMNATRESPRMDRVLALAGGSGATVAGVGHATKTAGLLDKGPRGLLNLGRWESLPADLGKRYGSMAKPLHPDRTGNDPVQTAKFRELTEAFDKLTGKMPSEPPLLTREGVKANALPFGVMTTASGLLGGLALKAKENITNYMAPQKTAGCMLGSRRGDKDSMSPARSASGESVDIAYTDKQDQYAKGKDAWDSVSTYFKGHSKRVKQPDLAKGQHSALTKEAKAYLGRQLGKVIGKKPIVDAAGTTRPPVAGFSPLPAGAPKPVMPKPAGGAPASPTAKTTTYVPAQPPAASTNKPMTTVSRVEGQVADASKRTATLGAIGTKLPAAKPAAGPGAMGEIGRSFPELAKWLKGGPRTWMAMLGLGGGTTAAMSPKTALDLHSPPPLKGPPTRPEEASADTGNSWAVPAAVGGAGLLGLAAIAMRRRKDDQEGEEKDAYDRCTDFAKGFFRKCDEMGVPLEEAVEKVGSDFGEEARAELLDGLEKVAWKQWLGRQAGHGLEYGRGMMGMAPKGAAKALPPSPQGAYSAGAKVNPYVKGLGRPAAQTAGGALAGGMSGNDLGVFGDDKSGPMGMNQNAMWAGVAAFNPWARRFVGRQAGGYGAAPLTGLRTGFLGSFAGSGVDQTAGAMGFNQRPVIDPKTGQPMMGPDGKPMMETDNTFGSLGGKLGFGAGLARQVGTTTASRMGANAPKWLAGTPRVGDVAGKPGLNQRMVQGEKGMRDFAFGTFDPIRGGLKAVARKPIQWASGGAYKGPSWAQPGMRAGTGGRTVAPSAGRVAGRITGGVGLGAGAIGLGSGYLNNKIDGKVDQTVNRVYNEAMPQILKDLERTGDQYMGERGMLDPNTGQFDPSSKMMKNLGGGADSIFRAMGMDPSKMSPLQKVMILGGATAGTGGALAGSPVLAGMGGASAMAGLLPQFMPGQGQQRQNAMFGPQAGQPPGQPQGQQPGFANRNEWYAQGGGQE